MKKIDTGMMSFTNLSQLERNSPKSIYTYNCGYYTIHNKSTNFTEANSPSGYLLIYLHKGPMQVLINGQSIKVSDGHVLIYQPKQERHIIYDKNEEKAKALYDFLDQSEMFKGTVAPEDRSLMNVPFVTTSPELDAKFIKEAEQAGLTSLKGHRLAGGMRASIYNAMPVEGVKALIDFMQKFEMENK